MAAGTLSPVPVTELRVMSFNIWVNGGLSLPQCIEAIRTSEADLVGLQECNAATAQTIAASLGFDHLGVNDVSIVSRYPILRVLPTAGGSGVTVELSPGQRVHLFNCHLAAYPYGPYSIREGQDQAFVIDQENQTRMPALNRLIESMAPLLPSQEPCFLTGDFNAPSHLDYADYPWPTSLACETAGLLDAYRIAHPLGRTYPPAFSFDEPGVTWTPMTAQEPNGAFDRIDLLFHADGDGTEVVQCLELDQRNSASPWPSDHRAVLGTFSIAPPVRADKATQPVPADGSIHVTLDPLLSWLEGSNTVSHLVYFGTHQPLAFQGNLPGTSFTVGPLQAGTTYFWRVDESKASGVVTGDVWSFTTRQFNTYEWNFSLRDLSPVVGSGLLAYADGPVTSNLTQFGTTDGISVPHIANQPADFLHVPAFTGLNNGLHVTLTGSEPNGGGTYINQYTLIWDLLIPSPLNWTPLFNTNPQNENDADFYVDSTGSLGIATIGYAPAGVVSPGMWHRIAFAADLSAGTVRYYVDGQPVFTGNASLDGRHSLYSDLDAGPDLLLFNEGDTSGVYTHPLYLSSFLVTDRTLGAEEILSLGGPGARGIVVPPPPLRVSVELEEASLQVSWTGSEPPYLLQVRTLLAEGDWQTILGPNSATNAVLPVDGDTGFIRVVGNAP